MEAGAQHPGHIGVNMPQDFNEAEKLVRTLRDIAAVAKATAAVRHADHRLILKDIEETALDAIASYRGVVS